MSHDMNAGGGLGTRAGRRPPRYNVLAVMAPFVGAIAVWIFLGIAGTDGHWYWNWRGTWAMIIFAGACVLGLVSAVVALVRSERHWGVAVLGLVINAPIPLLLLFSGLGSLATWLRYG